MENRQAVLEERIREAKEELDRIATQGPIARKASADDQMMLSLRQAIHSSEEEIEKFKTLVEEALATLDSAIADRHKTRLSYLGVVPNPDMTSAVTNASVNLVNVKDQVLQRTSALDKLKAKLAEMEAIRTAREATAQAGTGITEA
jgi:hypothetical protein